MSFKRRNFCFNFFSFLFFFFFCFFFVLIFFLLDFLSCFNFHCGFLILIDIISRLNEIFVVLISVLIFSF